VLKVLHKIKSYNLEEDILSLECILSLCVIGFVAAFIDSIAGGGGIISLPGLMV